MPDHPASPCDCLKHNSTAKPEAGMNRLRDGIVILSGIADGPVLDQG
jgi:hypothetical protein